MVESDNQAGSNKVPPYSRHPGKVAVAVIDFSTKSGWNHWKMATEQVQKEIYDCKPHYDLLCSGSQVELHQINTGVDNPQ